MKKYCMLLCLLFYSAVSHASERCVSDLSSTSQYSDLNKIFACFSEKIEVLENEIEELKGKNPPITFPPGPPGITPTQTVENKGFTFNLLQCTRKRQEEVTCDFSVVSNKSDKTLHVYSVEKTRVIDALGIEHFATSASIGGSEDKNSVQRKLISDVSMILTIDFLSIPSSVKGFVVLEVKAASPASYSYFDLQFKNVAIVSH